MNIIPIPNGWHIDALPNGRYFCVIRDKGIQTHLGFEATTDNCLFPQINPVSSDFIVSGQSNNSDKVLNYFNGIFSYGAESTYGISPIIYDNNGERFINSSPAQGIGAAGYRYCDPVTNVLVTGDATAAVWNNLNERTYVGDGIYIGQGNSGGLLLWDGEVNRVIDEISLPRFIRARREQGTTKVTISYWQISDSPSGTDAFIIQTNIEELKALPIYNPIPVPEDKFEPISAPSPNGTLIPDTTKFIFSPTNSARDKNHPVKQYEIEPNKYALIKFKSKDAYEIWSKDSFGTHHEEDASASSTYTYRFTDTRWAPKEMKVGYEHRFVTGEHQAIFTDRKCKLIKEENWNRSHWILAHYKQFHCGLSGIHEVIKFVYAPPCEVFYFALGIGWIGWEMHDPAKVFASGTPVFNDSTLQVRNLFCNPIVDNTVPLLTGCSVGTTPPNPEVPPMTLKKPEVTVLNWSPEVKNGWEFDFIDRENPGFGARVWAENGSFYASFTNPVGSGRTGAVRKFKECGNNTPTPIPPPNPNPIPPGPISRIRVDGLVFRDEANNIFPYRGFSSFSLFKRFLDGEDIVPYLKAWVGIGYNLARVFSQVDWTQATGLPSWKPSDYPHYWTALPNFLNLLSQHGLYCELTAHTFPYDLNEQIAHVNKIVAIGKNHKNFFLELTNEPPVNGIDVHGLFNGLDKSSWNFPWSSGQYDGDENNPAAPRGTYIGPHLDRGHEWPRKFRQLLEYRQGGGPNNPTNPANNCPVVHDEPIGGWDVDVPGRRSANATDFYTHGAGCQMHGAGGTYHHESGRASVLPDGVEWDCAIAFAKGLRTMPPTMQLGDYTRIGLVNCPIETEESLGTWGMVLGGIAYMVRVRPFGPYTVKPGWTVSSEDSQKIVITLTRV